MGGAGEWDCTWGVAWARPGGSAHAQFSVGGAAVDGWGVFYGHPWVCPLRSGEQSWLDWEFGIRRANPSSVKSEISDSQTPGLFTDLS